VDHRREGVEQVDLDLRAGEADRVADRVAVDRHLHDRGVDEAHVEPVDAGLPSDALLGLCKGAVLRPLHEPLELRLVERPARVVAADGERRGRALHELAGDADHCRHRSQPGSGACLVHGGTAVRDDGVDVAHRA
jgi:hypothetical protein